MKTQLKQFRSFLVLAVIFGIFSCSQEESVLSNDGILNENLETFLVNRSADKLNVFKGPEVQYGLGKARSWISVNRDGFPIEIGIELTPKVLSDLTLLNEGHELTTVLPLHKKAKDLTPFEHLGLNYQPEGHGPVFWDEHIDFHFYTITNEERLAIPEYDPDNQTIVNAFNYFPDMTKMPSDYFKFPGQGGVYAKMGKHWVPQDWQTGYNPFTHVMILGSYAQINNFIEPMVTIDYLLSGDEFSGNYSQPETFEESGNNYPTKYNIFHDDKSGKIYITLSDFVTRN
tara:strand:- start:630 stop:1487 length:858 start_codon:yes stop_codon:yes gene_type:complete